jgi:hypothetical protein
MLIASQQKAGETPFILVEGDGYFQREEVSNSDLGWLEEQLAPREWQIDKQAAYRFGTLLDAIVTDPDKVNHYNYSIEGRIFYTPQEFSLALEMAAQLRNDPMAAYFIQHASAQTQMIRDLEMNYEGLDFNLKVRCKWDWWLRQFGWGGDLKSTVAETQEQFIQACKYFKYDRQRALYMDIAGSEQDILIGVSKKPPHNVFKLPIRRGDEFYNSGKAKYIELAYKWISFF